MFCKNCNCQSCTDERNLIEREFLKVSLSLSTENRTEEEILLNKSKISGEESPKYDILTATLKDNRTFSVRFNNHNGKRDGIRYRISLFIAKKNLCAQIKIVTNKKPVIVGSIDEDLLDYINH